MRNLYIGLLTGLVAVSATSCIKTNKSKQKVEFWSPDLSSSLRIGTGYNPETGVFREDCTNLSYYVDTTVEKETSQHKEHSALSESSNSSSLKVSGSVNLSLGKQSGGVEASHESESQGKVTVSDDYIFMKRKEVTINPDFLGELAIRKNTVNGAFFNNCGREYVNELAYGGALNIKMNLSSSSSKDLSSLSTKISASPQAWIKGLLAEAEGSAETSSEYKDLSLEISIDSNVRLDCFNDTSSKVCSLESLEGCSALLETIDSCKANFRKVVEAKPVSEFTKPIYVSTSEYPALSATAAYWQGEMKNSQNYITTLESIKKVDISQANELMIAATLQDSIAQKPCTVCL